MKKAGRIILLIMGIICIDEALTLLVLAAANALDVVLTPVLGIVIYNFLPDVAAQIAANRFSPLVFIMGFYEAGEAIDTAMYWYKIAFWTATSFFNIFICLGYFVLDLVVGILCIVAFKKQKIGLFITLMAFGYIFGHYVLLAGGVLGMIGCLQEDKKKREAEMPAQDPILEPEQPFIEEIA